MFRGSRDREAQGSETDGLRACRTIPVPRWRPAAGRSGGALRARTIGMRVSRGRCERGRCLDHGLPLRRRGCGGGRALDHPAVTRRSCARARRIVRRQSDSGHETRRSASFHMPSTPSSECERAVSEAMWRSGDDGLHQNIGYAWRINVFTSDHKSARADFTAVSELMSSDRGSAGTRITRKARMDTETALS